MEYEKETYFAGSDCLISIGFQNRIFGFKIQLYMSIF
ncbi:hypothetical protein Pan153_48830 [Gimesia panareensis]|uniref:Uncharacterized protein n=1 Tax=Gimesia panareensis TaxID=2527978 RepID=A0A517QCQ4_9PLAN|nr:hypothetical protein Enr10x_47440 [Gimesia panareensis]QDU52432.1 hypothetical protein Pan110_48100 [Gimesia panareensis]QDV20210.1 hypothetical protein Pan153_48830 [Gimesia panareensis]